MRERDGRILEGDERRGILGGEEEYVLCLIYHGCCRGSVECSVRERELYAGGKSYYISFSGNNKVHDTYCKNSKQRYTLQAQVVVSNEY